MVFETVRARRGLRWWVWVGYWAFLFVVMHIPIVRPSSLPVEHADKLIHFVAYFVLTMLGGRYLFANGNGVSLSSLLLWAAIYTAYAGLDESLQALVGRTMSLDDWLADVAGIVVASLALVVMRVKTGDLSGRT